MRCYRLCPGRQKKSFRHTAKSGLWQIFQLSIFVLSREKYCYQSYSSYFCFLSPLESLNVAFGKRCELFIVLAVIILEKVWKTSTDWEWWRLCYLFINLAEWRERRVQCKRLIGDIRRTWKNIVFFQKLLVVTYLFFFVTHHVTNVW